MDRNGRIKSMFDTSGFGLEIGPSYNPLLRKSDGYNVEILDYADAETLQARYTADPNIENSIIEIVDYISDGGSLLETIGTRSKYDFIYASHAIEHVTDIVGFLADCDTLLKPEGVLVLAVPDKRYCFDFFRPVSTVGQALQAHQDKSNRHPASAIFDHIFYSAAQRGAAVWTEQYYGNISLMSDIANAKAMFEAATLEPRYFDAHRWIFVPSSFRLIVKSLNAIGAISLMDMQIFTNDGPTERHEFYSVLSKSAPNIEISFDEIMRSIEDEIRSSTR